LSCFGKMACYPTPALSLCVSPDLCSVLRASLAGWLFALPLLSASVALPVIVHWEFCTESSALCPTPVLWGRFSIAPLHLCYWCQITAHCLCCLVLFGGGLSLPRGCTGLFSHGVGRTVAHGVCCSSICSVDSCKQLWNWLAGRSSVVWGGFL
jgi:hypothetical protein